MGEQYDSTHVYVAPENLDRFVASIVATFGGSASPQKIFQVTPTPSQTISQAILTPVGTLSVFGFTTPIPYPFGLERTGYLVNDLDVALKAARGMGADVQVAAFPDAIGRDAVIEWPGGVRMQLYWHKIAPPAGKSPVTRSQTSMIPCRRRRPLVQQSWFHPTLLEAEPLPLCNFPAVI